MYRISTDPISGSQSVVLVEATWWIPMDEANSDISYNG